MGTNLMRSQAAGATDRQAVESLHEVLRGGGADDDHLGRLVPHAPSQRKLQQKKKVNMR